MTMAFPVDSCIAQSRKGNLPVIMKSKKTQAPRRRSKRNNIWAPWRIEYILGHKDDGCFLCDMFRARNDRKNHILARGRTCGIVMNRYPYSTGHLMVAPYRHVAPMTKLTRAERSEMMELTNRCIAILDRVMHPQGYNVGINIGHAAGAGLKDHIHMHIVPRWVGDTNFMPVLADVKVLPQALDDLWDALHSHFKKS